MRVFSSIGSAAVAVAATVLLAPAALAHNAPGDNGTIKIHDAKTGEELVKNEPHVCAFYLDAFFFDGLQQADWKIVEMPPTGTKDRLASSGGITLDGAGHGRTADMTLPDGHYKLLWNFDGENGKAKQKVFWTDCADEGGSGGSSSTPTPSGSASDTSGGASGGGMASGGTQPSTSAPASGGSSASPVSAAAGGSSGTPSGGSLASTGTSVIGITGLAAALLAVGVTVRFRRRSAGRH
jgi:hypothetical protein